MADFVPVSVELVAVLLVQQKLAAVEPEAVVQLGLASMVLVNVVCLPLNVELVDAIELGPANVAAKSK